MNLVQYILVHINGIGGAVLLALVCSICLSLLAIEYQSRIIGIPSFIVLTWSIFALFATASIEHRDSLAVVIFAAFLLLGGMFKVIEYIIEEKSFDFFTMLAFVGSLTICLGTSFIHAYLKIPAIREYCGG